VPDLVQTLKDEIETLREKVKQLEALLAPEYRPPLEWCLTESEARVFAALLARDVATKEQIMHALYAERIDREPEMKILDVLVCKMRKKLAPHGINIVTVWGIGYSLQDRAQFKEAA
jgi:two-component system cell cycle response regulator CtrA